MSEASWTTAPRWYLWDGGFAVIGATDGIVPAHAHHAIQIVITIEGEVGIRESGDEWLMGRSIIVPPNVVHSYAGHGRAGAMLFIDPDSIEGAWLRSTIGDTTTVVPESRVIPAANALRRFCEHPFESMDFGSLIRFTVESLCAGVPPSRHADERVRKVLDAIAASDDLRLSLEQVAASVHLSPTRFQHLFKQQVGLPFRRYVLWRKVVRAMVALARERTLAAAAQRADFADAAHLTRTFHQMFGMPPSVMMQGRIFVVPSPFELAEAA